MKLINQMPKISHADIGLFHVEYTIRDQWDEADETEMGDWLARNCTENYIFAKDVSTLIGGGCTPIHGRWTRYKKQRARGMLDAGEQIISYHIRLDKADDVLFKLTYLSDLDPIIEDQ